MRFVVTNNPKVRDCFAARHLACCYQLIWVEGYTEDVLRSVRDLSHQCHRLLTHPLTGSIKPNQTPYKTVVMENTSAQVPEPDSVVLAETALAKTVAMLRDRPRPEAAFRYLDDFAVIDLDFFLSYLGNPDYPC